MSKNSNNGKLKGLKKSGIFIKPFYKPRKKIKNFLEHSLKEVSQITPQEMAFSLNNKAILGDIPESKKLPVP